MSWTGHRGRLALAEVDLGRADSFRRKDAVMNEEFRGLFLEDAVVLRVMPMVFHQAALLERRCSEWLAAPIQSGAFVDL